MKAWTSVLLFAALSFSTTNASAQSNELDLFILAGQSNAQGWKGDGAQYPSDPEDLDAQILLNYEFIRQSTSNGWTTMQPQDGRYDDGHFGPEVSFSRELLESGYAPAIFKFTKGATSLHDFWKTPGKGGQYDQMIVKLKEAVVELETQGYQVNVRGFIWIQGESDTDPGPGRAYFSSLSSIISDLRAEVDEPSLPILLGVDDANADFVAADNVIPAQQAIAANDPFIEFTSMVGLPKADATHLTPKGLVLHGERLYDAMADLLSAPSITRDSDNLALLKSARLSSTGYGGVASRANDGNVNGNFWHGLSVAHTNPDTPTVQDYLDIDLGEPAVIDDVRVWNRTDCCTSRLSDFNIFVSTSPITGDTVMDATSGRRVTQLGFAGEAGRPTTIDAGRTTGRYVRLQLNSYTDTINLSELEIMGSFVSSGDN